MHLFISVSNIFQIQTRPDPRFSTNPLNRQCEIYPSDQLRVWLTNTHRSHHMNLLLHGISITPAMCNPVWWSFIIPCWGYSHRKLTFLVEEDKRAFRRRFMPFVFIRWRVRPAKFCNAARNMFQHLEGIRNVRSIFEEIHYQNKMRPWIQPILRRKRAKAMETLSTAVASRPYQPSSWLGPVWHLCLKPSTLSKLNV